VTETLLGLSVALNLPWYKDPGRRARRLLTIASRSLGKEQHEQAGTRIDPCGSVAARLRGLLWLTLAQGRHEETGQPAPPTSVQGP
jgi:hypothetical protein